MKGSDLKAFRKVNGLTQTMLGEFLGINKSFISTIESGKTPCQRISYPNLFITQEDGILLCLLLFLLVLHMESQFQK